MVQEGHQAVRRQCARPRAGGGLLVADVGRAWRGYLVPEGGGPAAGRGSGEARHRWDHRSLGRPREVLAVLLRQRRLAGRGHTGCPALAEAAQRQDAGHRSQLLRGYPVYRCIYIYIHVLFKILA